MCTLAALYHTVPGYDLVLGMNRDEDRLRPSEPPQALPGPPPLVAPRDSKAGGTWLGVSQGGLVAALANRPGRTSTSAKSRGLLLLEVLREGNVRAAGIAVDHEVAKYEYNLFTVLVATREEMRFLSYDGQVHVSRGHEGLNVLTNAGGNLEGDERLATIRGLLGATRFADAADATRWLESTMRHHGGGGTVPLCNHVTGGGTVSSTILALHNSDPGQHVLLYANGSPCQVPYRDYSHLLQELNPGKS